MLTGGAIPRGQITRILSVNNSGSYFISQKFGGHGNGSCVLILFVLWLVICVFAMAMVKNAKRHVSR